MLIGEAKKIYQRKYMRLWRIGRSTGKRVDRYQDRYCAVCGYGRVVDTHHKDSNRENNLPSNLIDLCPNCHALITRGLSTLEGLLDGVDKG